MPKKVSVLIRHPPFGTIHTFEGLRAAAGLFSGDHKVTVIYLGDGVFSAIDSIDKKYLEQILATLLELEAKIVVEKESMEKFQVEEEELIEGLEVRKRSEIAEILVESDAILTF